MAARTTSNQGKTIVTKGTDDLARSTKPDVCLVPPKNEPKPFDNWVTSSGLRAGMTNTALIGNEAIWTKKGELGPLSEPAHEGRLGGKSSATYRWEATSQSSALSLFFEGSEAMRVWDRTYQNHENTVGLVLPASMKGELLGMPGSAECLALWAEVDREAANIIKPVDGNHRERNRVIVGAWSDCYLGEKDFHWMGMAAYASKQVGCGMDSALEWQSFSNNVAGAARASGNPLTAAAAKGTAALSEYTYNVLGDTNRLVFLDAYPMHRFYQKHGLAKLAECASARPGMSAEALKGFQLLDAYKKSNPKDPKLLNAASYHLLQHEQLFVIQPLAYDQNMMKVALEGQKYGAEAERLSGVDPLIDYAKEHGISIPKVPAMQLTLTAQCDGGGALTVPLPFNAEPGRGLYNIDDRMTWINGPVNDAYNRGVYGTDQQQRDLEYLRRIGNQHGGVYPNQSGVRP